MASIPVPYSPRPTPRARRQVVSGPRFDPSGQINQANAIAGVGRALGAEVNAIEQIEMEQDAASAADADVAFSAEVRALLHDPESGYLSTLKQDAVLKRKDIDNRLGEIYDRALEGLSPGAQQRVKANLGRRREAAALTADTHASAQSRAHLDGASQARLESIASDALVSYQSDAEINEQMSFARGEIGARARRLGWSLDEYNQAVRSYESTTIKGVAYRRAQDDPVAALQYARDNADRLDPADLARIEGTLEPEAKKFQGRQWVAGKYNSTVLTGAVDREFVTSAGRKPDLVNTSPDVLDKFARLQGELGRKLPINSGFRGAIRNQNAQGVSGSQHLNGNALDIHVGDMSKAERIALIERASALGFTGIGVYGNAIHLDIGRRRAWGPSTKFESVPGWAKDTIKDHNNSKFTPSASAGTQDQDPGALYAQALEIDDPVVRDAALSEIDKRQKVGAFQERERRKQAQDALFKMVEENKDPASAPVEIREAAGLDSVRAIENYFNSKNTGRPVKTDLQAYVDLASMEPEQFAGVDLMTYRDRLSDSDFKRMADRQAAVSEGGNEIATASMTDVLGPAGKIFNARGIHRGEAGSAQAQEYARLEAQMVRTIDQWHKDNPGQTLTRAHIMDVAESLAGSYSGPPQTAEGFSMTPASLRSAALADVRARIGKPSDKAEEIADFETAHLQAARSHFARTGQEPTPDQAADIARGMLVNVAINGSGFFDEEDKFAYQVTAEDLDNIGRGRAAMVFDGKVIDAAALHAGVQAFVDANGYEPSIYQLVAQVAR